MIEREMKNVMWISVSKGEIYHVILFIYLFKEEEICCGMQSL